MTRLRFLAPEEVPLLGALLLLHRAVLERNMSFELILPFLRPIEWASPG